MSHWCDVKIKLSTEKELIPVITEAVKGQIKSSIAASHDPNMEFNFGAATAKLTWCSVRPAQDGVFIFGYTRWGISFQEAYQIISNIISEFPLPSEDNVGITLSPAISNIDILVREDTLKVYRIYKWRMQDPQHIMTRAINPDYYPDENVINTDLTSLKRALKDHGELFVFNCSDSTQNNMAVK